MPTDVELSSIDDELSLLETMYPEIVFDKKASQINYKHSNGSLSLRLPAEYPLTSLPKVVEATGPHKCDLRGEIGEVIHRQEPGEPCLDAILAEFIDVIERLQKDVDEIKATPTQAFGDSAGEKTIIVWLHHLLATGKRKQALSPDCPDGSLINGITKPGYPGILIFSGPAVPVEAHVQTLKHLRWQAFQIRYEVPEVWSFTHGEGIVEMETMAEIVSDIDSTSGRKDLFMEIMKIK